jgi:dTDP-glucose 4,6-dehydratase
MKRILLTGGCGFIGTNFCEYLTRNHRSFELTVLDKNTYAATGFERVENMPVRLVEGDITTPEAYEMIHDDCFDMVIHMAAESHVDNSIACSQSFMDTNIMGTYNVLEAIRMSGRSTRFVHVSTDEVFGSTEEGRQFHENTQYDPSSPYAASKAASDHLVRAWHKTYGMDTVITNCSNNYGGWQHREKLIPKVINNALDGKPIPIYGSGAQKRDWLYVEDHCRGILSAALSPISGETFLFGGSGSPIPNWELVDTILSILSNITGDNYANLMTFVEDRKGHDQMYDVCWDKARDSLGWEPEVHLVEGLRRTCEWYLEERKYSDTACSD